LGVFITLTSTRFYISIGKSKFDLTYLPIFFVVVLEFLQFYHITNGSFDFGDIWLSAVFWLLALWQSSAISVKHDIRNIQFNFNQYLFIFSYSIVYLAHVIT
jgi:hypothetical protein